MFIIGIAGGSGSGKTTFAKKVINNFDRNECALLHMDSYYKNNLPPHLKTNTGKLNFDHPEAFDWDLLRKHINDLKQNKTIHTPVYDFATSSRTQDTVPVGPCPVILFEGIFSLFDQEIRSHLDIKCFLRVEADIRFTRRLHRDVNERARSLDSVIAQYYDTVRPMYMKFLDPQKEFADFTVGEETDIAAQILSSRIKEHIKGL